MRKHGRRIKPWLHPWQCLHGCDRNRGILQSWGGLPELSAWVKLRLHLSGFYREAQMINSQVGQGNQHFDAHVFKNLRFIFSECWSQQIHLKRNEKQPECANKHPSFYLIHIYLNYSQMCWWKQEQKNIIGHILHTKGTHMSGKLIYSGNYPVEQRGSGWTLKWGNATSLINELPSEEPMCFLICGDRWGRGLKHTEPEGTKVY